MLNDLPLLLCVDLQNEFIFEGRPHTICNAAEIVARCKEIQNRWRRSLWPVVHLKRIANAAYFNPASSLTEWVDGAGPIPPELTFEHPLPSAYSSAKFSEYMSNIGKLRCVVAGFSLNEANIATIIEGFHRGDRYELLQDAVGCSPLLKPSLISVLKSFCRVVDMSSFEEMQA
jgi:nicotinamidase-related amidase